MTKRLRALATVVALFCATQATADERQLRKALGEHQRGLTDLQSGEVERARKRFERALSHLPAFPPPHMALGQIALRAGQPNEALARFQKARQGYDELGELFYMWQTERYNLAQTSIAAANDDVARLRATRSGSANDAEWRRKSMLAIEARIDQLRAVTLPARKESPEVPAEVHFAIGNAMFQLGRTQDAVTSWERSVELEPALAGGHANLTLAYLQLRRLDDARLSHTRAEALGHAVDPSIKATLDRALAHRAAARGGVTVIYEDEGESESRGDVAGKAQTDGF